MLVNLAQYKYNYLFHITPFEVLDLLAAKEKTIHKMYSARKRKEYKLTFMLECVMRMACLFSGMIQENDWDIRLATTSFLQYDIAPYHHL